MAIPEVIKDLLENGVHFGHLSKHWNPKMKRFIFGKKKNIYIIDLEKTAQQLAEAKEFVKNVAQNGEKVLFVATKRQLRQVVKEQAASCVMPYVSERWVGGLLTNYSTIQVRVRKYITLLEQKEKGVFDKMPGKEVVRLNRELDRMRKNYAGIITMGELPACLFVIDPKKETACVREARKLKIPIVALIDTDANPEIIDYPIPGNDDAMKSVRYITASIIESIKEGLARADELKKEAQEAQDAAAAAAIAEKEAGSKKDVKAPQESSKKEPVKEAKAAQDEEPKKKKGKSPAQAKEE